jgi:hypothetical protein
LKYDVFIPMVDGTIIKFDKEGFLEVSKVLEKTN